MISFRVSDDSGDEFLSRASGLSFGYAVRAEEVGVALKLLLDLREFVSQCFISSYEDRNLRYRVHPPAHHPSTIGDMWATPRSPSDPAAPHRRPEYRRNHT